MMHRVIIVIFAGLVALSLAGCGGQAEETPTPEWETEFASVVSVTGEVVPEEWTTVSAQVGGSVAEVLVEEGDEMTAGGLLLRLDATDAELAVQQARAALENARAQLALLQADPLPGEIAAAEGQVAAARAELSQAAAERDRLTEGGAEADVAAAEAEVARAEQARKEAQLQYDEMQARDDVDDWKRDEAAIRFRAAEEALDAAQKRLSQVRGSVDDRVREANANVWATAAQRDIAEAQLALLLAAARAEQIAVAQAEVARAQVELDAAQVALERTALRSPFTGSVGMIDVRRGELVSPGQPIVTIGDLSTLRVETTDLDEIDVARVEVGQQATITFDALPDRTFNGAVIRIYPMAEPGGGGVNYTVIIELEELAPEIRWGMTAFVDIEVGE